MSDITKKPSKLHKYFDDNYKREYYYNQETGESMWELPKGQEIEVIDCTVTQEESLPQVEEKKETEVEKRIREYKTEMSKFDQ